LADDKPHLIGKLNVPSDYHAPKAGPDPEALKRAFLKCGELATSGGHKVINLAVPAKGSVQGLIEDFLGEEATRLLLRDNRLSLGVVTSHLVTKRLPPSYLGSVLAAWTDIDQLKGLARSHLVTDVVYVPWVENELTEFKRLYPNAEAI
jgi:hypothetical protein